MAVEAVIGHPFTFQVLFVNGANVPIVVNSPTLSVFTFSGTGVKQYLLNGQALGAVVPPEVGRYTHTYTIPTTLTDGEPIYAEMTGVDPVTTMLLRTEQELTAVSSSRAGGECCCGLTARFIRGDQLYQGGGSGGWGGVPGPCGCGGA